MNKILVREALPADTDTIIDFQLAMAVESESLTLDKEILRKGVAAVFDDPQKGKYFVCTLEGSVIASLMITFEWSDWRNGMVLWIQSVYVRPEHRKLGVFRKMYDYLKAIVDGSDAYRGLRLYVDNGNSSAISVYNRIGMNGDHYRVFEYVK